MCRTQPGAVSAGNSLVQGGLVIDLNLMDSITLNPSRGTVSIGAGQRLGEVYKTLMEMGNYTLPAGQCAGVGISGYAAGGGLGQATRKLGWLSDSLEAVRGVTAEGEIIAVNSTHHPGLLWALQGGGANYIIVTEWEFKLYAAPEVFSIVSVGFPADKAAEAMAAYLDWQPWQLPAEWALVEAAFNVDSSSSGDIPVPAYMYAFYWGPAEEAKQELQQSPLLRVPGASISAGSQGSWPEMLKRVVGQPSLQHLTKAYQLAAQYTGWQSPAGTRPPKDTGYRHFKASSIMFTASLSSEQQQTLLTGLRGLAKVVGPQGGFVQLKALGGPVLSASNPTNAALPHRDVVIESQIYAAGVDYSQLDAAVAQVKDAMANVSGGSSHPFYYNYFDCNDMAAATAAGRDAWDAYFGSNAAALRATKAKYDPNNRIQGMYCGQ